MSGEANRPRSGARYVLERVEPEAGGEGSAPTAVVYRGFLCLPDADVPLEVRVDLPGGAATATLGEVATWGAAGGQGTASRSEHTRMAAALVRSATKSAAAGGEAFPKRIVRWRG